MAQSAQKTQPPMTTATTKLRSACNQCNCSKVKCSGDRDGCTRCRGLLLECIYEESRVGKVQPPRKRKKSQATDAANTTNAPNVGNRTTATDPTLATSTSTPRLRLAQSPNRTEAACSSLEDTIHLSNWPPDAWGTNSWDGDLLSLNNDTVTSFEDTNGAPANTLSSLMSLETTNASLGSNSPLPSHPPFNSSTILSREPNLTAPNMDGNHGSNIALLPPLSSAPRRESNPKSTKLDSKCFLACTKILITLESYIISELKALDLILGVVRKACDELRQLIQYQQQSQCDRCLFLFVATMHQVIELLDQGTHSMEGAEDTDLDVLGSCNAAFMPSFGFGGFSVSAEDQRSWKTHLIRREVQHVEEAFKCLIALSKSGLGCASTDPVSVEQRENCLSGLQQRFKVICDKLFQ